LISADEICPKENRAENSARLGFLLTTNSGSDNSDATNSGCRSVLPDDAATRTSARRYKSQTEAHASGDANGGGGANGDGGGNGASCKNIRAICDVEPRRYPTPRSSASEL